MSTYWGVVCRTCDEPLGLDGNHQEAAACAVVADADKLAQVGKLLPGLIIDAAEHYHFYGDRNSFSVAWFVRHAGHDIVARDEYGRFATDCNVDVACPHCGAHGRCRLPARHPGDEHDARKR